MVKKETLDQLALSEQEYGDIVRLLGRKPNILELGLFGSLWSEHCGYKHSKPLLSMFAREGSHVMVAAGEENAGVVDVGNGLAVVMKIESHNHPSAIEPYQGAATGVGGIVRDIFAMGARPIALLNSLRFGPLSDPANRYLFGGVVAGISAYGNCIGIPDVGGEIYFSPSYSNNPLVNAMCVGIVKKNRLMRSISGSEGNLLMLVGADTGKDGIHGASGLASRTFDQEREMRPAVQVGDPFLEKILVEACLEVAKTDHVVGMQDLGAAGLTSAIVELAHKCGRGIELDLSRVPRRDIGMTSYEVMLSESQERMVVVVKPDRDQDVKAIFDKWDIQSTVIGKVTNDGLFRVFDGDQLEGEVPVRVLAEAPQYRIQGTKPEGLERLQNYPLDRVPLPSLSVDRVLLDLLASPNVTSKQSVYKQYDHQVRTDTVVPPGGDAAVLRIKHTPRGLALATDGNGRYCYLDPFVGGMIAVAEACRNVSCSGANPVALTNCLNFGNPENQEVYYQLEECIKGMAMASETLDVPIISGNVSLYNETRGEAVYPTPVVGALGLFEDVSLQVDIAFKDSNDVVVLLGASEIYGDPSGLAGSEYLELVHNLVAGHPVIDLDLESTVQSLCRYLVADGVVKSSHDCSTGGLAVALAESSIAGSQGFRGDFQVTGRWDAALFGEYQSRIIVSLVPDKLLELEERCRSQNVPWLRLGYTGGDSLIVNDYINLPLSEADDAFNTGPMGKDAWS